MAPGAEDTDAWPNLFLVGAPKCGTTSLYHYLGDHPEIFMSEDKEPDHFAARIREEGPVPEDPYLALFAGADQPIRGEASTTYLHPPGVPQLIWETVPDARILIALRDPVRRAHSQYWDAVLGGSEEGSFHDAVERELASDLPHPWTVPRGEPSNTTYVARSLYHDAVERYLDRFGPDRVHVVLTEDLKDDPLGTLRKIAAFLEVDPDAMERVETARRHNVKRGVPYGGVVEKIRTSETLGRVARAVLPGSVRDWIGNELLTQRGSRPPVEDRTRRRLWGTFGPDVSELEDLLGRDLPELRRTQPDAA